MIRTPAYRRLLTLPALFRGRDLTLQQGMSSTTASQSLWRWKHDGLVAALGGRSDVFANLLVSPNPDWDTAVRMAMPSAVIIGIEALRRAGWTTQIPQTPDVAVRADRPHHLKITPFSIQLRDPRWFERVLWASPVSGTAAATLPPAWALADLLMTDGWDACGLSPEDVDTDEATEVDHADWRLACAVFDLPFTELEDVANHRRVPGRDSCRMAR